MYMTVAITYFTGNLLANALHGVLEGLPLRVSGGVRGRAVSQQATIRGLVGLESDNHGHRAPATLIVCLRLDLEEDVLGRLIFFFAPVLGLDFCLSCGLPRNSATNWK